MFLDEGVSLLEGTHYTSVGAWSRCYGYICLVHGIGGDPLSSLDVVHKRGTSRTPEISVLVVPSYGLVTPLPHINVSDIILTKESSMSDSIWVSADSCLRSCFVENCEFDVLPTEELLESHFLP